MMSYDGHVDINLHIQTIRRDLEASASLGDEGIAEAGRRLSDAIEPSLRLRLFDVLADAAVGLSGQLGDAHVEVRLVGSEPELVFVSDQPAADEPASGDDLSARITLRLPEGLKAQVETAAGRDGVSTNAWIVKALSRALEPRTTTRRSGNRLQGYARS
jgi:predicted HicB family RNase H-like nuclease